MSKRDYNKLLSTLKNLKVELYLSYKDIEFNELLLNFLIRQYELVSYIIIEEDNSNFSKVYLHINDFVIIQKERYKESYAIVKGIFQYKDNNKNNYAFIIVDWFKNTGQNHLIL